MADRLVFPIGNLSKNELIEHMSRKLLNEAIIEQAEKKYKKWSIKKNQKKNILYWYKKKNYINKEKCRTKKI